MLDDLGAGFVHSQRPIIQNYPVQSGDRSPSLFRAGHLDESNAAGLTGIAILHDGDTLDRAKGSEERSQLVFGCLGVKVPNENVHHGLIDALELGRLWCAIARRKPKEAIRMRITSSAPRFRAVARSPPAIPSDL